MLNDEVVVKVPGQLKGDGMEDHELLVAPEEDQMIKLMSVMHV